MIVNLSGSKIWAYFGGFFFFVSSYRNDILVTSFWRPMNRNNWLSLITGAQTIWSALHLIAGATISSWSQHSTTDTAKSISLHIWQTQTGWPSIRLCLFLSILSEAIRDMEQTRSQWEVAIVLKCGDLRPRAPRRTRAPDQNVGECSAKRKKSSSKRNQSQTETAVRTWKTKTINSYYTNGLYDINRHIFVYLI